MSDQPTPPNPLAIAIALLGLDEAVGHLGTHAKTSYEVLLERGDGEQKLIDALTHALLHHCDNEPLVVIWPSLVFALAYVHKQYAETLTKSALPK